MLNKASDLKNAGSEDVTEDAAIGGSVGSGCAMVVCAENITNLDA